MSAARRLTARLRRVRDPGLLICGLVCFTIGAALVAVPLGFAVAGVSFVAMDLVTGDRPDSGSTP